jgi:hypothetical protein
MIEQCKEFDETTGALISDTFVNRACQRFNGTISDWNALDKALQDAAGMPGTEPTSLFTFMLVMAFFSALIINFLNKRKESILREIYSKISIVER